MNTASNNFELPRNIERYLASLSSLYTRDGNLMLQQLIVNAQIRVVEEWSSDNWNGGTYGHALYLMIPEPLFLTAVKQKGEIQNKIKEDLNKFHNIQNEFVAEVFIEMELAEDYEWRKESGLLISSRKVISPDATTRIWGEGGFRVFLSHKSEVKKETADLKTGLKRFGVASFVAHEDIQPTKAWQDEIENALGSMDAFVALMTEGFHDSNWTDQEVGYAFARGVPIIAVRLGKDPYGFIGKFQGLSCSWGGAPVEIVKLLIDNARMTPAFIAAVKDCSSFDEGNRLAEVLPAINSLAPEQIDGLVTAYNENSQLRGSFGFNGGRAKEFRHGLDHHLNRLGPRRFRISADKKTIEVDAG